jgi:hypothetical protein
MKYKQYLCGMKFSKSLLVLLILGFTACDNVETTTYPTLVDEESGVKTILPPELEGLKIYSVMENKYDMVKVAVLNGQVNSTTWQQGKHKQSAIMVNTKTQPSRVIEIESVLMENDSVIMCRKSNK